jgi:hypothetical protein
VNTVANVGFEALTVLVMNIRGVHAGFSLLLFFDPEDGSIMFHQNVV